MGLISKTVMVKWNSRNKKRYETKGYIFTKMNENVEIKIEDLSDGNHVGVDVKCDCCGEILKDVKWQNYLRYLKEDGKYYCNACSCKLFGNDNKVKNKIENGKSFQNWCIENNKQDILKLWDCQLNVDKKGNVIKPSDITYGTNIKYWFKCPMHIEHKSELKNIKSFTGGQEGSIECFQCKSFAQWGIDNICSDFLEKYWSKENILNPWELEYGSKVIVKMICQDVNYHDDYEIGCNSFTNQGGRCTYCCKKKIHPLDSLGKYIVDNHGEDFFKVYLVK